MASNFQPILSQSGPAEVPQTPVAGIDTSGIATTFSSLFKNKQAGKIQAQKDQNTVDKASLFNNLLSLQMMREDANIEQQQVDADLATIRSDSIPDSQQQDELKRIASRLQDLYSIKTQGVGNDNVFNLRKLDLYQQALTRNPMLGDELNTLFNGDISSAKTSADTTQSIGSSGDKIPEIMSYLRNKHGDGNFGLREYEETRKTFSMVANYEFNKRLGNIKATELVNNYGHIVDLNMADWADQIKKLAGPGSVLSVENMTKAKNDLFTAHQKAMMDIDEVISKEQSQGRIIESSDRDAIYKAVDDKFKFYASLLDGKDWYTNLDKFTTAKKQIIENNLPFVFQKLPGWAGTTGGDYLTFIEILKDERLKAVATASGQQYLEDLHTDASKLIASGIDYIIGIGNGNGIFKDPGMQQVANMISTAMINKSVDGTDVPDQVPDRWVKYLADNTTNKNGLDPLPADILDAVRVLQNEDYTKKMSQKLTSSGRAELKLTTRDYLSTTANRIAGYTEQAAEVGRNVIVYDPAKERFLVDLRGKGTGSFIKAPAELNKYVELANELIKMSRNPVLDGIAPSKEEVLNTINSSIAKVKGSEIDKSSNIISGTTDTAVLDKKVDTSFTSDIFPDTGFNPDFKDVTPEQKDKIVQHYLDQLNNK